MVQAAVDAGATTINIPDTVGYSIPDEFSAIIRTIRERVQGIEKVTISVHCHNDLGLAVANTHCRDRTPARARWSAPSTASASAPAMPHWKRSPWR